MFFLCISLPVTCTMMITVATHWMVYLMHTFLWFHFIWWFLLNPCLNSCFRRRIVGDTSKKVSSNAFAQSVLITLTFRLVQHSQINDACALWWHVTDLYWLFQVYHLYFGHVKFLFMSFNYFLQNPFPLMLDVFQKLQSWKQH